jgi:predicted metal-dependent hydrolase
MVTQPLRYMRPHHHPGPEAVTEMAVQYIKNSPAAKAARERAQLQGKTAVR